MNNKPEEGTTPSKNQGTYAFWQGANTDHLSEEERELLGYLAKGLIFEKPDCLMLRCRMTGAELKSEELRGLAEVAKNFGGGYADVTTRANFQIRDISFTDGIAALQALREIQLVPAVRGLNNLRNVTVSPTSGFGRFDVFDVIPLARSINEALLFHPDLQGLPGKFNIGLDSGGAISVASESNDIGLIAVSTSDGVKFRMSFADIRKGETIATDTGWLLHPDQVLDVVSATVKIFLREGDFKVRLRSRVKFVIEQLGLDKFMRLVIEELGFSPELSPARSMPSHRDKTAYCGIWEQADKDFCYLGVVGAAGRVTALQMTAIADIAETWGNGTIRLTTKQTCIIPFVKKDDVERVVSKLREIGLSISSQIAGAIVACTGSQGCGYSATDTKLHSKQLIDFLNDEVQLDEPVNIHFTGCTFSCAQTYIGDIGLLGVKSKGQECYHLFLGGGADQNKNSSRIFKALPLTEVFSVVKQLLLLFKNQGQCGESFNNFVNRVGADDLSKMIHT
ncbi:precorrin-3B synthase [Akkermansiaceae bacterium]|nr:precorrin-3B synthase [Akkermansiaceae bacterium]